MLKIRVIREYSANRDESRNPWTINVTASYFWRFYLQTFSHQLGPTHKPDSDPNATAKSVPNPITWLKSGKLTHPILAGILADQRILLILLGIAALQIGLTAAGWPAWQCPIQAALNISCPGCGISRASILFLQGDWQGALRMHAFAPVILLGFAFLATVAVLPEKNRIRVISKVRSIEKKTGFVFWILLAMVIYWVVRSAL